MQSAHHVRFAWTKIPNETTFLPLLPDGFLLTRAETLS